MAITLTETAANQVKAIMEQEKERLQEGSFLRLIVSGGGCSGYQHQLNFDSNFDEVADEAFDNHGVRVVVDKKSKMFVDGSTIDYFNGLDRSGFQVVNPNVTKSCGCGSSFQV